MHTSTTKNPFYRHSFLATFHFSCILILLVSFPAATEQQASNPTIDLNTIINNFSAGIDVLMTYYDPNIGLWQDPNCIQEGACQNGAGWWYWGNALRILADYQKYASSGHVDYTEAINNIFSKNLQQMTSAGYFDDEGWWGLALISLYEATGNISFLDQAKNIANDMKNSGQQTLCGNGGIFWDAAKTQVGSIANQLYISLCAKIAMIDDPDQGYRNQAIETFNWLQSSGLIGSDNIFLDHYSIVDQNTCGELIGWTFTYTNGVILSGLVDLTKLTGDNSYMELANNAAKAAIAKFASDGMVSDEYPDNDPKRLAEDALMFKGVFVYNLAYLGKNTNDSELKGQISELLNNNYNNLIESQGSGGLRGYVWEKGIDDNNAVDIVSHLTTLYLIDGVVQLNSL